jgi:KDO2-lipid IV(A) lauroyltransferase
VQLLLKFLTRLPLPVLYELSRALFRVAYYVFRWRRPLAAENLRNAFPEKTESERATILKRSYRNLADLIVETLYGYGASATDMQSRVRIENPELLRQCTEDGQSVVLLAAPSMPFTSRSGLPSSIISCAKAGRVSAATPLLRTISCAT